jgi:TDG/mug DNA glycosylase family protein
VDVSARAHDLLTTVTRVKPQVVAILGITAYRTAFATPKASTGRQPGLFAGTQLWVVPNPSGLNAHSSLAEALGRPVNPGGDPRVRLARRTRGH